jgi:glycosyltransferase involved in cell wall biosynthesis
MLSVVIPTHESEQDLVRTLAILVAGAAAGVVREVIVADAGSQDATAEVADYAGCRLLVSQDSLGARLRAAAASARAPWLMFLNPGTLLDATWIDDTVRFAEGDGSRAAAFRPGHGAATASIMAEALALLRLALRARPHPAQGLLIAKTLYDSVGGHHDRADAESDLLRRLGRRRIAMLRSAAMSAGA